MGKYCSASYLVPVLILLAPMAASAGEPDVSKPALVLRVRSLNALLENLELVVKLAGQENAANQIEGLIRGKIGKQGLEGIDPTRPFGAYVRMGKKMEDTKGTVLIPIADQATFLRFLANQIGGISKDKDEIYTVKTDKNFSLHFRFANNYLYATSISPDAIRRENLLDPEKTLDLKSGAALALVARLDQLPGDVKLAALTEWEKVIETAQKVEAGKNQPMETPIQKEFRIALLREISRFGKSLIFETGETRIDFDIDRKSKEITLGIAVAGTSKSELEKTIRGIGSQQSTLSALAKAGSAFHGGVHFAWPDGLNKAFADLIDEAAEQGVAGIREKDTRKDAEALFKALTPTAKAGDVQLVVAAMGPKDNHYSFLAALKLKDGVKLGTTARALLSKAREGLPTDELKKKIELDADGVGPIKIHRFELPKDENLDKLLTESVGDRNLYLAFRDDALFFGLGKDALAALKIAIAQTQSADSPPLVFAIDVARMVPLMARTPEHHDLATKLFPPGENGQVRLTLEGGNSLTARLRMRLSVVEFLVKMKK